MTAMYTMRKGGSYDRFKMMIKSFLEKQWEVHCLSLTPIKIDHPLFHNHVIHFPSRTVDGFIARFVVLFMFPLWSFWVVWRKKIDLIIAFGSLYAFIQGLAKWWLKKYMVTLIRGKSAFGLETQNSSKWVLYLNNFIENGGIHFSDRIITNNAATRVEILKNLGRRKNIDVQVLYNNIPPINIHEPENISRTKDKYGIPRDVKVLVTAGILNRGKNIELLIKCLPIIEEKNVYVLIAGDGSTKADFHYKDSLQRLAKELEVERKVIFTGWLEKEKLWKIYVVSDLFVLPSLDEGMPNAMLEALGSGLPCMGSNIPGIRDILQYDELLFDPRGEGNLIAKIHRVFSNHQWLAEMKRLSGERKEAFEFDWGERVFQLVTKGFNHVHDGR